MGKVASLGNFKWSFYSPSYPFSMVPNIEIIWRKKKQKELLASNRTHFSEYLNSTSKPDLNTKKPCVKCMRAKLNVNLFRAKWKALRGLLCDNYP